MISKKIEYGDWQTPVPLAEQICSFLQERDVNPHIIYEPTCGKGSFLLAANQTWSLVPKVGYDINQQHLSLARDASKSLNMTIQERDFFTVDWTREFHGRDKILVVGNPPWVTVSQLGRLESVQQPTRSLKQHLKGFDHLLGKSNFDVSEWMTERLLRALKGKHQFWLAFLLKYSVARKLIKLIDSKKWPIQGEFRHIDAKKHFDVSVSAGLFFLESKRRIAYEPSWPVYESLSSYMCTNVISLVGSTLVNDVVKYERTKHLRGSSAPEWRSGLKHDCSSVMEFTQTGGKLFNQDGTQVDLEDEFVYPLLKGSDIANGHIIPKRAVLVTQKTLGQPTDLIAHTAPKTWTYLTDHKDRLDARKSSIYKNKPPFSMFGIGKYAFAPWKVAIAGLYKHLSFTVIGPWNGKPVMFDDTVYFLSFETHKDAIIAEEALYSKDAQDFFEARIFWDGKRPITKRVLQALNLEKLIGGMSDKKI